MSKIDQDVLKAIGPESEFVCNTNDKTISMAAIDSCVSNDGIKSLR